MKAKSLSLSFLLFVFVLAFSSSSMAKLLFHDNFEGDKVDSEPSKWVVGHKGATKAKVVADPQDAKNKVLQTTDKASNQSRHDVGGSIYVAGDDNWGDYVAEFDMMFPDDFYMGVVFRFTGGEAFYLSDRRMGGNAYNFYRRQGGWTEVKAGSVPNKPLVWYRAQLTLVGDTFTFKLKERDDKTSFDKVKAATEGKDATFKKGKFGNYGLVYLDNLFIGDTIADLVLSVESDGKLSATWGKLKSSY